MANPLNLPMVGRTLRTPGGIVVSASEIASRGVLAFVLFGVRGLAVHAQERARVLPVECVGHPAE